MIGDDYVDGLRDLSDAARAVSEAMSDLATKAIESFRRVISEAT